MDRRKFMIGAGSTAIGMSALVGSGAFSSVDAERSVSVETTGDADANLALYPNEDYGGDQEVYVGTDDKETLELTFEDVNRNAVTTFDDLFVVKNNGTQSVYVTVNNDFGTQGEDPIWGSGYGSDGPMDIMNEHGSIVGGNQHQTEAGSGNIQLGPGESMVLSVEIDTRGFGDDSWKDGTILFRAI